MKTRTDLYTKAILTVIAVLLALHLVKDMTFVDSVNASVLPAPDAVHATGVIDVNIVQVNGMRVGSVEVPVKVKN